MGLLDKAKAAAEQAAIKAKETAAELQAKRELGQAYDQLGQKTFELIETGEVSAAALEPLAERVRVLKASLEAPEPVGATAAASAADEMPEPPATPTV
jgi:plasmid stabilization system protein ParE